MQSTRKGSLRGTASPIPIPGVEREKIWMPITFNLPDGEDQTKMNLSGSVWTDGTHIYYGSLQYDPNSYTWTPKTWKGLENIAGSQVFRRGDKIYYAEHGDDPTFYVLNGDTWEATDIEWPADGYTGSVWSNGASTFHSNYDHYLFSGTRWSKEYFNCGFVGSAAWSDGTNVYINDYQSGEYLSRQIVRASSYTGSYWSSPTKAWNIEPYGLHIWTDGDNVYYSKGTEQYVLKDGIWEPIVWEGLAQFHGNGIWTDGRNLYCSKDTGGLFETNCQHYILKAVDTINPTAILMGYSMGAKL